MAKKRSLLICLSGLIWLFGGAMLLSLGTRLILLSPQDPSSVTLPFLSQYFGLTASTIFCALVALSFGYFKARFVLIKTVQREVNRIAGLVSPSIKNLFTIRYALLVALMLFLSFLLKYFELSNDLRGIIDIAIGSALLQGAIAYFRFAYTNWKANYIPK